MPFKFKIEPLPLLKKINGRYLQCFEAILDIQNNGTESLLITAERGETEYKYNIDKLSGGINVRELYLEEAEGEEEILFRVYYKGEVYSETVTVKPIRRWTIFLLLHSHTDLGFTAPISDVAKIHDDNSDTAVLYCEETKDWPKGCRFKWNLEVSWQLQNYLKNRDEARIEKLLNQVKEGNIELCGMYAGELTEIMGHEEAVRAFYFAAKIREKYGIVSDTVMLCDVPGISKGLVQIMDKGGYKNLIVADNNFIAPFLRRNDLERPFRWLGDDNTEVLSWYTDHPFYAYIEGEDYGLNASYSETRTKLPRKLKSLEDNGYKFNKIQIQYAFDNFRIEFRPAAVVRQWNEEWEYPKIQISTAGEFLNNMREKHINEIPKVKGDWTNWWSGIVTGFPYETMMSRKLHSAVPTMEIINSILEIIHKQKIAECGDFNEIYDKLLAFDEHSGSGMVWEPKSEEEAKRGLKEGYGLLVDAIERAEEIKGRLQHVIKSTILNESGNEAAAVFNALNFKRSGVVELPYHKELQGICLKDRKNGRIYKGEIRQGKLCCYVEEIPAAGYKIFDVVHEEFAKEEVKVHSYRIGDILFVENEYYKIEADEESGKIISILSKKCGKEIVKNEINVPVFYRASPQNIVMGRYTEEAYAGEAAPGEILKLPTDYKIISATESNSIYGIVYCQTHYVNGSVWLEQRTYFEGENIIIKNIISGSTLAKDGVIRRYCENDAMIYLHFNFDMEDARLRYEAPCSVIEPAREQFKGACRDYYAVQSWMQFYDEKNVINFSSLEAPLIDAGEIALLKYRKDFPENAADIYVRVISLNQSGERVKSPYTNDPDLTFSFCINAENLLTDDEKNIQSANRTGQSFHTDLLGSVIPPYNGGLKGEPEERCVMIDKENIQLMTFKKAENGNGFIIRLREMSGSSTAARIKISGTGEFEAYKCMITEEIISKIFPSDGEITLDFNPYAIVTIRIINHV